MLLSLTYLGQGAHVADPGTLVLMGLTVVAMFLYGLNARRVAEPIIPLEIFRIRTVTISCLIVFIAFIELISLSVLIPLELQMLTSMHADGAALQLIPLSLSVPLGAYVGGMLMSRTGKFKNIQLTGTLMVPLGVFWLATISPDATALTTASLIIVGLGIGLQLPASTVAVQNSVAYKHVGVAIGVAAFCRSLGSSVGIAILMAFLMMNLALGAGVLGTPLSGADVIDVLLGNGSGLNPVATEALKVTAESAFQNVYRLAAFIGIPSIILTLLLKDEPLSSDLPPTARAPDRRPT